jgi:hypothetical protein
MPVADVPHVHDPTSCHQPERDGVSVAQTRAESKRDVRVGAILFR